MLLNHAYIIYLKYCWSWWWTIWSVEWKTENPWTGDMTWEKTSTSSSKPLNWEFTPGRTSFHILLFTLSSSSVSQSLSFNLLQSLYCSLSSVLFLCLQIKVWSFPRFWKTDTITTKVGVSLSLPQWKVLCSATQVVDDLISLSSGSLSSNKGMVFFSSFHS
jgi:hypothetical protein